MACPLLLLKAMGLTCARLAKDALPDTCHVKERAHGK